MAAGYFTTDGIDFNEIWYRGVVPAMDAYRVASLPVLDRMAMPYDESIFKYAIATRNGWQKIGTGQQPDRRIVEWAWVYPKVEKYGVAVGTDRDTLLRSTGREIMINLQRPFREDPENVLSQMLRVMMIDPSTSNAGGGFWNGAFATEEGITAPPAFQQNTFAASHNHYFTSGAATYTVASLSQAVETIMHHGYTGQIVALCNSLQRQELEDNASFVSTSVQVKNPVTDAVSIDGFNQVFRVLGVDHYVTALVPSGYVLYMVVSEAEGNRPLIHYEPRNLRGLQVFPGRDPNHPLIDSFWERWMGFKVWLRGAGACMQITASASFTDPTFAD